MQYGGEIKRGLLSSLKDKPNDAFLNAQAKKFSVPPDDLNMEKFLDKITPQNFEKSQYIAAFIDSQFENPQGKTQAEIDAKQNAAGMWRMNLIKEKVENDIDMEFAVDFYNWLQGKGKVLDHQKTPWGRTPVAHDPEVREYIRFFLEAKIDFQTKLFKLSQAYKIAPLIGINEHYLFFKYIVRNSPDLDTVAFLKDYNLYFTTTKSAFTNQFLPDPMEEHDKLMDLHEPDHKDLPPAYKEFEYSEGTKELIKEFLKKENPEIKRIDAENPQPVSQMSDDDKKKLELAKEQAKFHEQNERRLLESEKGLRSAIEQKNRDIDNLVKERETRIQRETALQNDLKNLQSGIQMMEQELKSTTTKKSKELRLSQEKLQKTRAKRDKLKLLKTREEEKVKELQRYSSQHQQLQKTKEEELEAARIELQKLAERNKLVETMGAAYQQQSFLLAEQNIEKGKQLEAAHAYVQSAQQEINRLTIESQQKQQQLQQAVAEKENLQQHAQQTISNLSSQITQLENEQKIKAAQLEAQPLQSVEEQDAALRQVFQSTTQIEQLKKQLEAAMAEKENLRKEGQARIDFLMEEGGKVTQQLQTEQQNVANLSGKVVGLEKEKEIIQKSKQSLTQQQREALVEAYQSSSTIEQQKREIEELKKKQGPLTVEEQQSAIYWAMAAIHSIQELEQKIKVLEQAQQPVPSQEAPVESMDVIQPEPERKTYILPQKGKRIEVTEEYKQFRESADIQHKLAEEKKQEPKPERVKGVLADYLKFSRSADIQAELAEQKKPERKTYILSKKGAPREVTEDYLRFRRSADIQEKLAKKKISMEDVRQFKESVDKQLAPQGPEEVISRRPVYGVLIKNFFEPEPGEVITENDVEAEKKIKGQLYKNLDDLDKNIKGGIGYDLKSATKLFDTLHGFTINDLLAKEFIDARGPQTKKKDPYLKQRAKYQKELETLLDLKQGSLQNLIVGK